VRKEVVKMFCNNNFIDSLNSEIRRGLRENEVLKSELSHIDYQLKSVQAELDMYKLAFEDLVQLKDLKVKSVATIYTDSGQKKFTIEAIKTA